MAAYLRAINSPCSILKIYGLLHGCVAAPVMAHPSSYLHMILGEETLDKEKQISDLLTNLMSLWNRIAGWRPEAEPFIMPTLDYSTSPEGLKVRVDDWHSFLEYFIKGLDLGDTDESDFSVDAVDAMESLAEAQVFLQNYSRLLTEDKTAEKHLGETDELLRGLEEIVVDCVARINVGLKSARKRSVEQIRQTYAHNKETPPSVNLHHDRKIGRNEPCPCKSGKKYKKCCGL